MAKGPPFALTQCNITRAYSRPARTSKRADLDGADFERAMLAGAHPKEPGPGAHVKEAFLVAVHFEKSRLRPSCVVEQCGVARPTQPGTDAADHSRHQPGGDSRRLKSEGQVSALNGFRRAQDHLAQCSAQRSL